MIQAVSSSGFVRLEKDARIVTAEAEAVAERNIDVDLRNAIWSSGVQR